MAACAAGYTGSNIQEYGFCPLSMSIIAMGSGTDIYYEIFTVTAV
jgi:hypothetical protein